MLRFGLLSSLFSVLLVCLPFGETEEVNAGTLRIEVQNIDNSQGCLRLALYANEADFMMVEQAIRTKVVCSPDKRVLLLDFLDLPFGEYALAAHHDENDNDELDTNLFGIPTEPFAFSKNPKVKWRSPRFREVVFTFSSSDTLQTLILQRWKNQ